MVSSPTHSDINYWHVNSTYCGCIGACRISVNLRSMGRKNGKGLLFASGVCRRGFEAMIWYTTICLRHFLMVSTLTLTISHSRNSNCRFVALPLISAMVFVTASTSWYGAQALLRLMDLVKAVTNIGTSNLIDAFLPGYLSYQ